MIMHPGKIYVAIISGVTITLYLISFRKYVHRLLQTPFSSKETIMTGHVTEILHIMSRKTVAIVSFDVLAKFSNVLDKL